MAAWQPPHPGEGGTAAPAKMLNLSYQQVQKYERGFTRASASALVRRPRALKCCVGDLVDETADERTEFDTAASGGLSER